MRRNHNYRALVAGCCLILIFAVKMKGKPAEKSASSMPESFYIVAEAVSDAAPFWFDYVLDVRPDGSTIMVRWIRIAPLDAFCPNVTVKAASARLPRDSMDHILGKTNPCRLSRGEFDRALEDTRPSALEGIFDTGRFGIVAQCGSGRREFHLPYPEMIDFKKLKRNYPRMADLWDLYSRVREAAFGKRQVFYGIPIEADLALQKECQSLVPLLRSGAFDRGFWHYCGAALPEVPRAALYFGANQPCEPHPLASELEDYAGPVQSLSDQGPELLAPGTDSFTLYVSPKYPPLAKMARIEGKVEISLTVDPQSGEVKEVKLISGHPLLAKSATEAAVQWRLNPHSIVPGQPVNVVLQFSIRCP